ncbi:MAG: 3-phosphoshikimate 1-carboxyvinyltransferase [Planctomycetota bacterium]|nr:3-phosphoshikimate 1-carboxyvinyltransferase [Planctomycetota bacterium]
MTIDEYPEVVHVHPAGGAVTGTISIPGSKSLGNRAILLSAAALGESRLRGLPDSDDADAALRALGALGVPYRVEGGALVVEGRGNVYAGRSGSVAIGSSGTVGRFLPGLLAASPSGEWTLVSTRQLAARPLRPLVDALRGWGAALESPVPGASFPLKVSGGGLAGGAVAVSAADSSQFASGLLLAAPLCREPAAVLIRDLDPEETYIDITLDLMRRFGVDATPKREGGVIKVEVLPQAYRPADLTIEADANSANYFFALAALTEGRVTVDNLDPASRQPGVKFLEVFRRLGCDVAREGGVSVAGPALPLRGGFAVDLRAMSEMALTLGVLAVFADAPIAMTNLAHVRGHESDRIAALAAILGRLGVRAGETGDSVTVHPLAARKVKNAVIDPLDDHRIAMSFSVLGAAANGISIRNPGCVRKTCPAFFKMLRRMGVEAAP